MAMFSFLLVVGLGMEGRVTLSLPTQIVQTSMVHMAGMTF